LATHPAYVVLGDVSLDSTPEARRRAHNVLVAVIEHARKEQGYVAATPFQNAAIANARWNYKDFLPTSDVWHDSGGTEDQLKKRAEFFKKQTRYLFDHQTSVDGTDIIGALISASYELRNFASATSRSVIIVSNMANVDYSRDGINLKLHLTANQVQAKLQHINELHEIPQEPGVYFYIVGGGQIPSEPIPQDVETNIRRFWNGYFVLSGGIPASWAAELSWPLSRKRIALFP
jgi:hypothetical protein